MIWSYPCGYSWNYDHWSNCAKCGGSAPPRDVGKDQPKQQTSNPIKKIVSVDRYPVDNSSKSAYTSRMMALQAFDAGRH